MKYLMTAEEVDMPDEETIPDEVEEDEEDDPFASDEDEDEAEEDDEL